MTTPVDASSDAGSPGTVTDDAFLGGKLQLLQPRRGYRAGLDAVLLAAAVPVGAHLLPQSGGGNMLDVGAGVGTVGLCAARRIENLTVTLLEREPQLVDLATRNIARNGLEDRVGVLMSDATAQSHSPLGCNLPAESFSVVVANPPYSDCGRGTPSADPLKRNSNALGSGETLDQWCRFMARMCEPGGLAIMIHTAAGLAAILAGLENRFGAILAQPLHPREGEEANRIIVAARKGRRAPLRLLPGIPLHGCDNAFTPRITAVLREGAGLDLPI